MDQESKKLYFRENCMKQQTIELGVARSRATVIVVGNWI